MTTIVMKKVTNRLTKRTEEVIGLLFFPKIWTVNNFYPTMSQKVFNTLRDHHQIPNNIPICLLGKFERCCSGKTMNVKMYDAMFIVGLRMPLTKLHRQLANCLGLFVSQIAPNAWRIFIGAEVIWG